jgi:uncharacterized protein (TIGR01777 family)
MKIVIPGGTGQVGTVLARAFHAAGDDVTVLTRKSAPPAPWRSVAWDGRSLGPWTRWMEEAEVVINLCGRSVDCRYTAANRRAIVDSRVASTRIIGQAIAQATQAPRVWLQASTATIYAHRYDAPNDEATGIIGGQEPGAPETWRFSIQVARQWEEAAREVALPGTRLILMRSAMIMSPDRGGVFDVLSRLVRTGLGGAAGDGRQFVSWIHDLDFIEAVKWLIGHDELAGPVNLCSPHPLPNREFMKTLRHAWKIPIGLPTPGWLLELGAAIIRTESELILKSRRVTPTRLLESGFRFTFPHWPAAAANLCSRRRQIRA